MIWGFTVSLNNLLPATAAVSGHILCCLTSPLHSKDHCPGSKSHLTKETCREAYGTLTLAFFEKVFLLYTSIACDHKSI